MTTNRIGTEGARLSRAAQVQLETLAIIRSFKWLEIYRRGHPGTVFVASPTKPRAKKDPKIIRGPGSDY